MSIVLRFAASEDLMTQSTQPRRSAFTLVELLVVIAIIGVLVAVLLPAVQYAREAARLSSCRNNLKQIGLAFQQYEGVHGVYPPSSTTFIENGIWSQQPQSFHLHSWASLILPHLEQENLHERIDYNRSSLDAANQAAAATVVSVYRCPSFAGSDDTRELRYLALGSKYAIRNYVAIGGTTVENLWKKPDGAIYPQSETRQRDLVDGSSHTFFIAETREQDAAVWIDGSTASVSTLIYDDASANFSDLVASLDYKPYYPSGGQGIDCLWGPSSMHNTGALHLLGDGSVQFIRDQVDVRVYVSLTTLKGGESLDGGF